jgi:hypothetical protein
MGQTQPHRLSLVHSVHTIPSMMQQVQSTVSTPVVWLTRSVVYLGTCAAAAGALHQNLLVASIRPLDLRDSSTPAVSLTRLQGE